MINYILTFLQENIYYYTKKIKIVDKVIMNEDEVFSREELENIDFKKLFDDNFIIRVPEPKFE